MDTTEKAHATLHARREARAGRLASALRALEKVGRKLLEQAQRHRQGVH